MMTPEQFLELGDLLSDPVFLLSTEGRIQAANKAALKLLARRPEQVQNHRLAEFTADPQRQLMDYLRLCSGSKQPLAGKLLLKDRDGPEDVFRCDGALLTPSTPDSPATIFLRCVPRQTGSSHFVLLNSKIEELNHEILEHRRTAEKVRQLNEELEQRIEERTTELKSAYRELESFSYSVSHDLRAPLRSINGFSRALLEDYATRLDDTGKDYLQRVCSNANRMGELIDDILEFARVGRRKLKCELVSLSQFSAEIVQQLRDQEPERQVEVSIAEGVKTEGDAHLLRIVLENFLNNAWKYTGKVERARIEFGELKQERESVYYVKDNGAGFDMSYAGKLFGAFQRLHGAGEFEGNGIGLATVQRIVQRHGGRVWADAQVGNGATFYFTLPGGEH